MVDSPGDIAELVRATWVVPVGMPALRNAAVWVIEGRIQAVGSFAELDHLCPKTVRRRAFVDSVIFPGFVNAHTHLELGRFAGRVSPNGNLIDWLTRLVAEIGREGSGEQIEQQIADVVQRGVLESLQHGVTCVGDIATSPRVVRPILADGGLLCVSYGEVIAIGNRRHLRDCRLETALTGGIEACGSSNVNKTARPRMRFGLSPHSPYTCEPRTIEFCVQAADPRKWPVCMHLAESPHEHQFTRDGAGPFAEYLKMLGVWDKSVRPTGKSPLELVYSLGVLGSRTLLAHGNYLTAQDAPLLAKTETSIVYCPRTHAAFGHDPHPFRELASKRVNVCVGTDSLVSNPDLSIPAELAYIRRAYPELPAGDLIKMGTSNGARALGFEEYAGTLESGGRADLAVLSLPADGENDDWVSVFDQKLPKVRATMLAGRWVYESRAAR